jgi:hypothetical protein
MLLRVLDTILMRVHAGADTLSVSIKLCRTGQPASKAYRDLSEIPTSIRLRCLRIGNRSAPAAAFFFPSGKRQPPKEATRRVDEKRWADAGSGGGGGIELPSRRNWKP